MLTWTQVKNKSASRLNGLHPAVRAATELLMERCYAAGVPILITQGLRTSSEQDALYAQGRTKPGAVVTNARGGYSYHNYGLAVDFALLLPGGAVSWEMKRDGDGDGTADWQEVVRQAKVLGFEWGGDWSSFKDYPHLQMCFGLTISELRSGVRPQVAAVEAAYKLLQTKEAKEMSKTATATVKLDGTTIADGYIDSGVTYVPVRPIAEALGLTVAYDQSSRTVTLTSCSKEAGGR
ncbi:M15 family metallopeptidase [Paenibacillus tengchongensis]|uniref:M15 family metallopeptidase n=1 Tax=Paenibacillus tengchongensis TaxID=2608684 RepID=UPI00124CA447|nr:M15 family metallopeptidase [Paenibacillus tengchongensis]